MGLFAQFGRHRKKNMNNHCCSGETKRPPQDRENGIIAELNEPFGNDPTGNCEPSHQSLDRRTPYEVYWKYPPAQRPAA
jgi:hypothetical protein